MELPKTTDLTLKTIVENMNQISDKMGMQKPTLTPDQKRALKEMALMFNEYGKVFEDEQKIMEAAKAVGEFMKLAETYAVNECGDVFQENIIKQNFQEASKKVQQLQKLAQECYVRKQQLATLFDDVRHYVKRYYKIADPATQTAPTPNTAPQTPAGPIK